jgi:tRNA(His) guanylyltransferase
MSYVKGKILEEAMRSKEVLADLRIPDDQFAILRLNSPDFFKISKHCKKPFDSELHAKMVHSAKQLMIATNGLFTFTYHDEISVLLGHDTQLFGRQADKLVSIAAAVTSGALSVELGSLATFVCRLWVSESEHEVQDYFSWRDNDCFRHSLSTSLFHALRSTGRSAMQVESSILMMPAKQRLELLQEQGIHYETLPSEFRIGTCLQWEEREVKGLNPHLGRQETATRRRVRAQSEEKAEQVVGCLLFCS